MQYWLACENVWAPCAMPHHHVLRYILSGYGITHKRVAIEHGLILYSADVDFTRVSGLRDESPLSD